MDKFTGEQVRMIFPTWPAASFGRFAATVLEVPEHRFEARDFTRLEFITMAVEQWFAGALPQFDESKRFHVVKALHKSSGYTEHIHRMAEEGITGFYVSVLDDRWFTWTRAEHLIDLISFKRIVALPQPHVWVTILGVTPLYLRILNDLETMECHQSRHSEAPAPD